MPPRIINHEGDVKVKVGDLYQFTSKMWTRAGHAHEHGSYLYVFAHTTQPVFDEIGQNGNWWCLTKHGASPWTTLESCISRKLLVVWPYENPHPIVEECEDLLNTLREALTSLNKPLGPL